VFREPWIGPDRENPAVPLVAAREPGGRLRTHTKSGAWRSTSQDRRGDIGRAGEGKAIAIGEHLPVRLSAPLGVDNCPYEITGCDAATATSPARIHGRLVDRRSAR
jgi:hypothetical protein